MPDETRERQADAAPLSGLSQVLEAGSGEEAVRFARRLYGNLSADDLRAATPDHLAAAALALMTLARRRLPGVAKVHVFDPQPGEGGWTADRSVLQIVNDDMPFLVDSVVAELARRDLRVQLIAHPVLAVRRDSFGAALTLGRDEEGGRESMMHIEFDRLGDKARRDDLAETIGHVLAEVRCAVEDWGRMRGACLAAIAELQTAGGDQDRAEIAECQAFLRWLEGHHFTLLGYRRYRYTADGYDLVPGSSLGILRQPDLRLFGDDGSELAGAPGLQRHGRPLLLLKTDRMSLVHRSAPMDCIVVKSFAADGTPSGEHRIVGLLTSAAYRSLPADIPILRRKAAAVLQRAQLDPESHDGKALTDILDGWPRDELFQIDEDLLYDAALGVLQLQERQRTALFERRDALGRYISCQVFVPRERWDSALRRRFTEILLAAHDGRLAAYSATVGDESKLARILFTIRRRTAAAPYPETAAIERQLVEAATTWSDRLVRQLQARHSGEAAAPLLAWSESFPTAYREQFTAETALEDLAQLVALRGAGDLGIRLERRAGQAPHEASLKLFQAAVPIPLSDILPLLENMGLRVLTEVPFRLEAAERPPVWLHDFLLARADGQPIEVASVESAFETALQQVWCGAMENDGLNRLALGAGLDWRGISLLRLFVRYLRQTGIPFGQLSMERTLADQAPIAAALLALFAARLDPALGAADSPQRSAAIAGAEATLAPLLDGVASLDEDRILRRLANLVACTLRSNFYQRQADGSVKPWISVKLDSTRLADLPLPRPAVEIFVCSPRVEAVHLRGGAVARGGIRWSDRREDFRSEVLGLMKAQMVKNAVIVPVGSKGGFFVKRPPAGGAREAIQAEGIECYRIMVRGMLDITDNIAAHGIVPPADTVRHDGDDPYLVVAADKGTASFSDIANALSAEYGFWLGDAFASGGSRGYDHKKMAITARGAWESVKRHFRDLGCDIQSTPFSVVGVGDMSGDVFGNAMLLSRKIRLLAAFDHRHIFIDPDPDPERSWHERRRLFDLPRSSWADYDKSLLSPGGAVIARSVKSIELSAQACAALGLPASRYEPAELIRALLAAPVDLLWFGGIGTYVRASDESSAEVGDRSNDALRIEGRALRARVIGEGANLGLTQRGRIEAAQAGVRLNTDALDNSAGVDTSDHEVNIKIALAGALVEGTLQADERERLLAAMTDDVAELVLRDNYQQSQAIGIAAAQAQALHQRHAATMRSLQQQGKLDRAVEFLPDGAAMRARAMANRPLTRPELCVLLAYAKIALNERILDSDLPDDPLLEGELLRYFPAAMRQRFAVAIGRHRLRREIIALQVVNSLVNRAGSTFVHDLAERSGCDAADIARAFAVCRDAWRLRDLWSEIEALDAALVAPAQTAMLTATQRALERICLWLLRHVPQPMNMQATADRFRPAVDSLAAALAAGAPPSLSASLAAQTRALVELKAPAPLAERIAALDALTAAGDIALLGESAGRSAAEIGQLYFALGAELGLDWLQAAAATLPQDSTWARPAASGLSDDLQAAQRRLTGLVLAEAGGDIARWQSTRQRPLDRYRTLLAELRSGPAPDLAALSVITRELRLLYGEV